MSDSRLYWVAFNLVKGVGAARMEALLAAFGDAQTAWNAPLVELRAAGLPQKVAEAVLRSRQTISLEAFWERLQTLEINILTWLDEAYPRLLRMTPGAPPVLYLRGQLLPADELAVAMVGTRRVTTYGRQVAQEMASRLAMEGITVVSGLARGVDTMAHQAVLKAGGRTLAVMGCGVDCIYPPENKNLAAGIIQNGALLSDYAPGTPPDAANFPPRNRIISGLARAVVVVEAGESSGALITAAFARAQERLVFAVPGGIYAPQSKGTNALIAEGARPLSNIDELLTTLKLEGALSQRQAHTELSASPVETQLLALLGREPLHVDELGIRSGLPIAEVSATLSLMELKGMVRQVGAMHYVTIGEESGEYRLNDEED